MNSISHLRLLLMRLNDALTKPCYDNAPPSFHMHLHDPLKVSLLQLFMCIVRRYVKVIDGSMA